MATLAEGPRVGSTRIVWIVVLVALSVLLNYVDRGAIGIAAPLMKQELGLSATGFGFAVSAFFWVYAPVCLVVGWLCDRFCVYRTFAAGVALWSLSTMLTGFVGGVASLIALRFLLGLGESIAFPGSSKIFAASVPAAHRGMANASVAAALAFGPAVGTLAGGAILGTFGWRPIFWVFGAVTLLWLVPWWIASAPLRAPSLATPAAEPVRIGGIVRLPALWLMGVAHLLSNYGFYFLLAWLPLYLINTRGFSIGEMTALATLGFAVQGVTALVSGRLSDTMSARGVDEGVMRRRLMVLAHVCVTIAILGLAVFDSTVFVAGWLMLAGVGSGLGAVNLYAIAQIFAGPRAAGSWVGVQNAVGNISGIVGPILTGVLIDRYGYPAAFVSAAVFSALGIFWWWKLVPEIRQQAL